MCVNDTESAAGALQRAGEMAVGSLISIQLQLFVRFKLLQLSTEGPTL